MTIEPNSPEFYTILGFTLFIVALKSVVFGYLFKKVRDKKKRDEKQGMDFIQGVEIFILGLLISRIFYIVFDFYYTKFDTDLYYLSPNIWFWKLGMIFANFGIAYVVHVVDVKILNKKYKDIFTYIILAGIVLIFAYPVNNLKDFQIISLLSIIPQLGVIFIPVIFFKIGRSSSGEIRKTSFAIFYAMLFYALGAMLVNAGIIDYFNNLFNQDLDVYFYLVRAILKKIGVVLFAYGAVKFRA